MEFKGQYYFLSNYYNSPLSLEINGEVLNFTNAEAAFQACRAVGIAKDFQGLSAFDAKALGKKAKKKDVRGDWTEVRDSEMERVLLAKFENPYLKNRILSVSEEISFDIQYPDRYWGIYLGKGQNKLGKALTNVRNSILRSIGVDTSVKKTKLTYKVQNGGLVVFDTETTGVSAKYDDIIQITIVGKDRNVLLSTYVRPDNCKEWPEAEAVNHISPADVFKDGVPTASEVAKAVNHIFSKADYILGYNVNFDTKMVKARFGYDFSKNKVQDVFDLYKSLTKVRLDKYAQAKKEELGCDDKGLKKILSDDDTYLDLYLKTKARKLVNAIENECPEVYEQFISNAHDACADTKATLDLAKKIMSYDEELVEECIDYAQTESSSKKKNDNGSCISKWVMTPNDFENTKSVMEDNPLFFVNDGVICLSLNVQGIVGDGFVKRIAESYPALKDAIRNEKAKIAKARATEGKTPEDFLGYHVNVPLTDTLSVEIIFAESASQKADGPLVNYDALSKAVKETCEEYKDRSVCLPVVTKWEAGIPVVTDAIGCGKARGVFSKIAQMMVNLGCNNLSYVDTQHEKIFKVLETPVCSYEDSIVVYPNSEEKEPSNDFDDIELG